MFKFLRHLFRTEKTTRKHASVRRGRRLRNIESLEPRLALAATTLVDDFDGIAGLEVATIESDRITIASAVNGTTKSYTLDNWSSVEAVNLDGVAGKELLFNNIRLVNGAPQAAKAMVLTFANDELKTYNVGTPTKFEIADLDGVNGPELLYTNIRLVNGNPQPVTATILNHSTRMISSYNVGSPNRSHVVNLDGNAGLEIAFTNVNVISGVPQPATTTILTYAADLLHQYDVGSPNQFDFANLDGIGGDEIVYSNVRSVGGVPQPAVATVLNQTDRRVNNFAVGSPNRFNFMNLDGVGGPELIFNNLRVLKTVPQPATTSVLNYTTELVSTYDVGAPIQYEFANLDNQGGVEIIYSNVQTIKGVSQAATATILNHVAGHVKSYAVGNPNRMSIQDLNGVAGAELLFDNVRSVKGVPQDAKAFIVTYASDTVDQYSIGSPTQFNFADLDGINGVEIVYSHIRTLKDVPQAATAVVLNPTAKNVKSYDLGKANQLSIASLDAAAGQELVYTSLRTVKGVPQPATATVVTYAADEAKTYDIGSPNRFEYAELNGTAGGEIVFSNVRSVNGKPQPATASILDHANRTIDRYEIGSPNRMNIVELDGVSGNEIVYSNIRVVKGTPQAATATVISQAARTMKSYAVGSPNRMEFRDLNSTAGSEILFDNLRTVKGVPRPATSTIVNFAADQVQTFDIGSPNTFRVVDLDGTGGPEVLYTNVRTVKGRPQPAVATIVNPTTQQVKSYSVGSPNAFSVANLDGAIGSELLFTNIRSVNGIGQPARATVVDYVNDQPTNYDIGSPNTFQIADLDNTGGPEVVFTNIRVAKGNPLPATATVLDQSNRRVKNYAVGNPNRMQVIELDGNAGNELLFDNVRVLKGVPQPAQAAVVTYAADKVDSYQLGSPNRFEIADLDGVGGSEVIYSNVRLVRGVPQSAVATILNQRSAAVRDVNLGNAKQLQVRQLDDIAGAELLALRPSGLAVYELGSNTFTTYDVSEAASLAFENLDNTAGLEVRFVTPAGSGILNHRLKQLVTT